MVQRENPRVLTGSRVNHLSYLGLSADKSYMSDISTLNSMGQGESMPFSINRLSCGNQVLEKFETPEGSYGTLIVNFAQRGEAAVTTCREPHPFQSHEEYFSAW
jgi:hypothetical protein